ncbi:MAG TPA: AraC family transcriptional regulator [Planctomycetota bacterium]|nr:AraC family transcriptional regulator [Planctomycetota bacterium]
MPGPAFELTHDEDRWQRARDALRLECAHARCTRFVAPHLGRNAIPYHRLFLVPSASARGSRVVDERARREWSLAPGTALLLPARRLYRFDFAAGLLLVGFHFRLAGPGGIDVLDGALGVAHATGHADDADRAAEAVALRTPAAWLTAEGVLRLHLGRGLAASWSEIERATAAARRWQPAIARLEAAPPGGADIARLASAVGISRQHFTRRFRADFGCTPRAWHQRQLARRVVDRLLADDAPLDEVADGFGFSDAFAFSRFVLRATGMRPSRWRQLGPSPA